MGGEVQLSLLLAGMASRQQLQLLNSCSTAVPSANVL